MSTEAWRWYKICRLVGGECFFVVPRLFRASLLRRLFYIHPSVKENPHEQYA